jgi:hypothetical protein
MVAFHGTKGQSSWQNEAGRDPFRRTSFDQKFPKDLSNACLNTSTPLKNQSPSLLICADGLYEET